MTPSPIPEIIPQNYSFIFYGGNFLGRVMVKKWSFFGKILVRGHQFPGQEILIGIPYSPTIGIKMNITGEMIGRGTRR
jgi:hypothetical protein